VDDKQSQSEQEESAAEQIVDAINGVFGRQARNRAVHAKGIVLSATFAPSARAHELSRAPHLQRAPTPVTARFSCFSGNPDVADTDPTASPRGLALKFHLDDGTTTDLVTHSFNGFPTATAAELGQLFTALSLSGPGATHPTSAERFMSKHPRARAFFETPKPPPVSYATLRYFGVNSFAFANARGAVTVGRYRLEPAAGEQFLAAGDAARAHADYLRRELRERVAAAPLRFTLVVQLAAAEDRVDDPSLAWPDTRPTLELGTLALQEIVADSRAAEEMLIFSPGSLPLGIAPADPMIQAREEAYAVSYARRHQPS
jgi:catalase